MVEEKESRRSWVDAAIMNGARGGAHLARSTVCWSHALMRPTAGLDITRLVTVYLGSKLQSR
eukprot:2525002-Rhodomonas_salina.1